MSLPRDATPLDRTSARRAVYEKLRVWIEDGLLAPGESIRDGEVASALGVSRTPVREALQMLEQHGAVEMLPGRRTRVTAADPEDVTLVYAPLEALSALATELGASRATADDVAELERHNEALRAAIEAGDALSARQSDRSFHEVFVRLAANQYLASAIEPMLMHIRRLEALYFSEAGPGLESYREHKELIAAVRRGDLAAASEITRRNFQRFRASVEPTQATH